MTNEFIVTNDDINHCTEIHNVINIGLCIESIGVNNYDGIFLERIIIKNF